MRIIFDKLRWKNFMSYGNQWSEIDFHKAHTTLIVGKNGTGKTTFIDALTFVLYKKSYRNINIPQLTNSIIGRDTVVEVEFRIKNKHYLVRRGIAPDIFEIYQDDHLLPKTGAISYQETLQKIIKIKYRVFCQIIVLGKRYISFFELDAAKRRDVTENLLDIQTFSTMNSLLRNNIDENEKLLSDIEHAIKLEEQKIKLHNQYIIELTQNNDELIKQKEDQNDELRDKNEKITAYLLGLNDSIKKLQEVVNGKISLEKKINEIREIEKQLKSRKAKLEKDIHFYSNNDNCPTCAQKIDDDFKAMTITKKQGTIDTLVDAMEKLKKEHDGKKDELNGFVDIEQQIEQIETDKYKNNNELTSNKRLIEINEKEIEKLKKKKQQGFVTSAIDENEIKRLKEQQEKLIEERHIQDVALYLLKDSGIKSKIIKQYVPLINKFINKHLAEMDFFVNFEIDENFNERIMSRFRDDFSFNSFSEGQKSRIDLALLFTWRSISNLKNSVSVNILILDEVFDSSLDADGTEKLVDIIKNNDQETKIFMISHKESMLDVFDRILKCQWNKNFSQLLGD